MVRAEHCASVDKDASTVHFFQTAPRRQYKLTASAMGTLTFLRQGRRGLQRNNALLSTSVDHEGKSKEFSIILRLYFPNEVKNPQCLFEAPSELSLASSCEKDTGFVAVHDPGSCLKNF